MSRFDDPFGLDEDQGRTRVRPPPGGRGAPPGGRGPSRGPAAPIPVQPRDHPNPLIAAFAALLAFAPELEAALAPADPETLRTRLLEGLVAARDGAVAHAVSLERADAGAWAAAALLDDLALNTPWGASSAWPRQPLAAMLYGDVAAGARFFDRLEELERHPSRDPEMLELLSSCLALGFRGKYRVPGRAGDRSLPTVRATVARLLRDPDAAAAPLSPNWQGIAATDAPRRATVPAWVLLAAAVAACAGIYLFLDLQLAGPRDELATLARSLPPQDRAEIYRPPRDVAAAASPAIDEVGFALLPEFAAAVPEAQRPTLGGSEGVSLTKLVAQASDPELFRPARAELTPTYEPMFAAIGAVLAENAEVIGTITVIGHTDSVPLSAVNPFGTNQELSEARADTVAKLLAASGAPDRLRVEGRAATEPVAANTTRDGRALNRRIEILVEKRP